MSHYGLAIALGILATIGAFVVDGFRAQSARTNELLRRDRGPSGRHARGIADGHYLAATGVSKSPPNRALPRPDGFHHNDP
jgi:hypothetical protein